MAAIEALIRLSMDLSLYCIACTGTEIYGDSTLWHSSDFSKCRVEAYQSPRKRLTTCLQLIRDQVNLLARATLKPVLHQERSDDNKQHAVVHCSVET